MGILKLQGLAPTIPEDLYHLIKKGVQMYKHMEKNKKDKDSKFRLVLVESRIPPRPVLPPHEAASGELEVQRRVGFGPGRLESPNADARCAVNSRGTGLKRPRT